MSRKGSRNARLEERDRYIATEVIDGRRTLTSVAKELGITRERVRQIIQRDHPEFDIRSANAADTEARNAAHRADVRIRQEQWREKVSESNRSSYSREWTREKMIANLQSLAEEIGHSPSIRDWLASRRQPSVALYLQRFGTWNDAKKAAGLSANRTFRQHYTRKFSEEDMIDAVAMFLRTDNPSHGASKFGAYQYDRWCKEMTEAGFSFPSLALLRIRLGSWRDVKQAAIEKNTLRSSDD
jgi:hypothetical protein